MVGVAECTPGTTLEVIHGYAVMDAGTHRWLAPTGQVGSFHYGIADHDVSAILTEGQWPKPADETGLDGGGLLLRSTRAPCKPGTTTCVLVGLITGGGLTDQTMMDLTGDAAGNLAIGPAECARHLNTNGTTLTQVMKRPLWGWSGEPWGLVSTLRTDVIDETRRLDDLLHGEPEAYEGERRRLERGHAGSVMGTGLRDDEYQRFRTLYDEIHGREPHEDVRTAERQRQSEKAVVDVVRKMLDARMAA